MGYYTTAEIVKIVNKLIDRCGTRDPYKVAKELGINIIYRNFDKQRGASAGTTFSAWRGLPLFSFRRSAG